MRRRTALPVASSGLVAIVSVACTAIVSLPDVPPLLTDGGPTGSSESGSLPQNGDAAIGADAAEAGGNDSGKGENESGANDDAGEDTGTATDGGKTADGGITDARSDAMTDATADGEAPDVGVDSGPAAPACFSDGGLYAPVTSVPVPAAGQALCSAADIQAFIAACGTSGSTNTCSTWQDTNVPGAQPDGGGGTACGNCIFPPLSAAPVSSTGPTYTVAGPYGGVFGPNYGGCVAILDPTNGQRCASALDNETDCDDSACMMCTTTAAAQGCFAYACSSQTALVGPACRTDEDGGAFSRCSPSNGGDADWQFIINLICGSGQ